jgi:hypothetical protein
MPFCAPKGETIEYIRLGQENRESDYSCCTFFPVCLLNYFLLCNMFPFCLFLLILQDISFLNASKVLSRREWQCSHLLKSYLNIIQVL